MKATVTSMDATRRAELERAYRTTTYAAGTLRLRIGARDAALDAMLDKMGAREWAYLTAWNPRGEPQSEAENRAGMRRLQAMLDAGDYEAIGGEAEGDDRVWPAEPSVLILDIAREDAEAIGRVFDQVAIVAGTRGGVAELVWL